MYPFRRGAGSKLNCQTTAFLQGFRAHLEQGGRSIDQALINVSVAFDPSLHPLKIGLVANILKLGYQLNFQLLLSNRKTQQH